MTKRSLQALLWKEWREHQMRLVACCAAVGVAGVVGFAPNPRSGQTAVTMFMALMTIAALVLPLFVSMALGAERHHGQLGTLLVQPIHPAAVFAVKTIMGCLTCIAPVLTIGLTAWLVMEPRAYEEAHVPISTLYGSLLAAITFIWMLVFGAQEPNEVRMGIVAIAVPVLWGGGAIVYILVMHWLVVRGNPAETLVFQANPLYFLPYVLSKGAHWPLAWLNVPIAAALWVWGAKRFAAPQRKQSVDVGRPEERGRAANTLVYAGYRPVKSLLWKEWRLNRPWIITGLLILVVMPAIMAWFRYEQNVYAFSYNIEEVVLPMMFTGLPLFTILIAVTGFGRELNPTILALFEARPISSRRWFMAKYLMGVGACLCLAVAPWLFVVLWFFVVEIVTTAFGVGFDHLWRNFWGCHLTKWSIPLGWMLLLYSIAALMTTAVRQPIYAGILSVGVMMTLVSLTLYDSFHWLNLDHMMDRTEWQTPRGAFMLWLQGGLPLLLMAAAATYLAWRIVRWDWWTEREA